MPLQLGTGVSGGKVRWGRNGGVLIWWTRFEVLEEEKEREIIHSLPGATLWGTTRDDLVRSQLSTQLSSQSPQAGPSTLGFQAPESQETTTQSVVVCYGRVRWRIIGGNGTRVTGGHNYRYCKNLRKRYTLIPWSNPGKMKDFKLRLVWPIFGNLIGNFLF